METDWMALAADHWAVVTAVGAALAAILGLTAWGRAHAEALANVLEAIEAVGRALGDARGVKAAVSRTPMSYGAAQVIEAGVARVDPKRRRRRLALRALRFAGAIALDLIGRKRSPA